jgi:hypothetical protein
MIISIPISDAVIRAAHDRGKAVEEFVETLIDKGMEVITTVKPVVMEDAIERIRALRKPVLESKR